MDAPTKFFDRERNYQEFTAIHGFDPRALALNPVTGEDRRFNVDPQSIGRRLVGKKNVLAAADKYC